MVPSVVPECMEGGEQLAPHPVAARFGKAALFNAELRLPVPNCGTQHSRVSWDGKAEERNPSACWGPNNT